MTPGHAQPRYHWIAPAPGLVLLAGGLLGACAPPDAPYDLAWACAPGGVAEIADDFDDNEVGDVWFAYPPGGGMTRAVESNGQLELHASGAEGEFANYNWTGGARSIEGCFASVEAAQTSGPNKEMKTYFILRKAGSDPGGAEISFTQLGAELLMTIRGGGHAPVTRSVTYDAKEHRFWRFREAGGATSFDTSPDAVDWTEQASGETPDYAGDVAIVLGLGSNAVTKAAYATFDNLNVAP